jgi:hypothetical protein
MLFWSKRKAQRGLLGCLASMDCELAMAQLNNSKFQPSVQKVTQLKKMPLLPGLLNLIRQPRKHHRCHCTAHEGHGDHAHA